MAKVWRGEYWKTRKNSPWFMVLLVLAALWAYGHANGSGDAKHPGARPSASASASARPAPGKPAPDKP
ncbi:hypothetical protein POF50_020605 [Streptomyces sp. SL13]|uniref:Uncharacterized protein n=1 Tax=Streptantibioticus silvisoli TaxID=2705255 RepID=A0AA90H5P8_9ACTN|nr:hypothetical protein [Streptantibioticus silvisoli]MDI5964233.1 hypothetical protein [Streptantibioticus silvisoli]MDI5971701.1 hypothetical protein [Streptantibioticus silvisoli]